MLCGSDARILTQRHEVALKGENRLVPPAVPGKCPILLVKKLMSTSPNTALLPPLPLEWLCDLQGHQPHGVMSKSLNKPAQNSDPLAHPQQSSACG